MMITSLTPDKLTQIQQNILRANNISESDWEQFIKKDYAAGVYDPFHMKHMKRAVDRICSAITNNEYVCVYSDYDCDGIPGGVLLREALELVGLRVRVYIPNRNTEGYGIHMHALDLLKEEGVSLMITVDLGITNHEQAAYAQSLGLDLIITDHHLPVTGEDGGSIAPPAYAVINPKQSDCEYPDPMLCGTGVAYKLASALLHTLRRHDDPSLSLARAKVEALPVGYEKWWLDLVSISTVADMVPLQNENRTLAHFGLHVLRNTRRPSLRILFDSSKLPLQTIDEVDIAFSIAPRINAASRLGNPQLAHDFLASKNAFDAKRLFKELDDLNTARKKSVKETVADIDLAPYAQKEVILIGDESWLPGVLGLIAQNILDKTGKPVFVYGKGEKAGEYKGSCRAKEGDINLVDLMHHCKDTLAHFGGHEAAGGFSCAPEQIPAFDSALQVAITRMVRFAAGVTKEAPPIALLFEDVTESVCGSIAALGPYGEGFPRPLFVFPATTPYKVRNFGKTGEHAEVTYKAGAKTVKAIKFFADDELRQKLQSEHSLIGSMEHSHYGGTSEVRLKIEEVRPV